MWGCCDLFWLKLRSKPIRKPGRRGPPNGSTNVSTRATCGRTPYSARTSRTLAGKMVKKSRKDLSYCIIALVDVLFRLCPSNCRGDAVGCSRECVLATGTTAWSHLFGQAWQGRDLWHQGIQILSSAFCWKLVDIEAQLKSRWPNVNPQFFWPSYTCNPCSLVDVFADLFVPQSAMQASGFVALRIIQVEGFGFAGSSGGFFSPWRSGLFGELFRSIFGRKKSWIFATSLKELIPLVFLDLDFFQDLNCYSHVPITAMRRNWWVLCWYCWWTKSCTTKDDDYPIIYKVWTIPGDCLGFLNHQQYGQELKFWIHLEGKLFIPLWWGCLQLRASVRAGASNFSKRIAAINLPMLVFVCVFCVCFFLNMWKVLAVFFLLFGICLECCSWISYQVIQFVTFSSPNVGGHQFQQPLQEGSRELTIPKR